MNLKGAILSENNRSRLLFFGVTDHCSANLPRSDGRPDIGAMIWIDEGFAGVAVWPQLFIVMLVTATGTYLSASFRAPGRCVDVCTMCSCSSHCFAVRALRRSIVKRLWPGAPAPLRCVLELVRCPLSSVFSIYYLCCVSHSMNNHRYVFKMCYHVRATI